MTVGILIGFGIIGVLCIATVLWFVNDELNDKYDWSDGDD